MKQMSIKNATQTASCREGSERASTSFFTPYWVDTEKVTAAVTDKAIAI